jgi:large subunit ribosomal protein L32e
MTKKEMITMLTSLKGIGTAKAEALIDAGYDTPEKIIAASLEDLTGVPGISESVATSLQDQLKQTVPAEKPKKKEEKPAEKKPAAPKKTSEKAAPAKKKTTQPAKKTTKSNGKKEGYTPKKKPELPEDIKQVLPVRKEIKKRRPNFYREEWFRYKRLGKSWRRPDGISSKMRRNYKYRPNKVRVGYRGPEKTRGLHPSGFEEVMVFNVADLTDIDPKTQAARIGGTVGSRKRMEIEKKAEELDVRILNKQR